MAARLQLVYVSMQVWRGGRGCKYAEVGVAASDVAAMELMGLLKVYKFLLARCEKGCEMV